MSIEGEIRIELTCQDERVSQVVINSTRPLNLPKIFSGKPVDELLSMIPMLYSICATAQSAAAVKACRQATGIAADWRIELLEQMLVNVETAREHLWRIMTDWSNHSESALSRDHLATLATLMSDARLACFQKGDSFTLKPNINFDAAAIESIIQRIDKLCHEKIFAVSPAEWYGLEDQQAFDRWLEKSDTLAATLLRDLCEQTDNDRGDWGAEPLPQLDHQEVCQRLSEADADAFIAAPDWHGRIYETGPLTRQLNHPLIVHLMQNFAQGVIPRLVARLLELASLPARLSQQLRTLTDSAGSIESSSETDSPNQGLGEVEAARGRLFHRAVQQQGKINQYQIVAPTEWNFHPQGVVCQGLKTLSAKHEKRLRQQAEQLISAVDPCVGFQLELV
ncbi:MAG: nickel-dependent hydrogenase large subunit [Candidatus Thiodiazotropha taylori]|nr:nickel-dependent hydrogenase large subunit [Candidatus Thiodiazotropha taylori]